MIIILIKFVYLRSLWICVWHTLRVLVERRPVTFSISFRGWLIVKKLRIIWLLCFVASVDSFLQEIPWFIHSFWLKLSIPTCDSDQWISETVSLVIVVDDPHFLNTAYFSTAGVKCKLTMPHRVGLTLVHEHIFRRNVDQIVLLRLLPLTHHCLVHLLNVAVIAVWVPYGQILFLMINLAPGS